MSFSDGSAQMSAKAIKEFERKCNVEKDPVLQARLDQILQKILLATKVKLDGVRIAALSCPEINAFSFPASRRIFIMRGLLDLNPSDQELSFIIAHEVAHHFEIPEEIRESDQQSLDAYNSVAKTFMKNCKKAKVGQNASYQRKVDISCAQTYKFWQATARGGISQNRERFTDELAVNFMQSAGLDPAAGEIILTKIASTEELNPIDFSNDMRRWWQEAASSHPPARERLRYINFWKGY